MKHFDLPLQPGDSCELTVHNLGYGGVGVARHDSGLVCLVPKTLPGERIRGTVVQSKRRHVVVRVEDILQASAKRTAPPCVVYAKCGGCHLQQLSYADQLIAKQQVLREHFEKSGTVIEVNAVQGATPELHYRNKNFFHVEGSALGFMDPLAQQLVDVELCLCAPERSNQLLATLRNWLKSEVANLNDRLLDTLVRESSSSGDTMIVLVLAEPAPLPEQTLQACARLAASLPQTALYLNFKPRDAKYSFGEGFTHLGGPSLLRESIGEFQLSLSPGSFVQIHPQQAAALYARAVEELQLTDKMRVLDLFSGSGALSLFLSRRAQSVYGVEMNRQAVLDAERAVQENGVQNVTFRTGKCETIVAKLLRQGLRFDRVVLNPPRTGCPPDLMNLLPQIGADQIAYVSCSPPTLRRDVELLAERGYTLSKLLPFDMFPQTYHCEVLALFFKSPNGSGGSR